MCGIKIPLQDFALKVQAGLMYEGDVFAGHYGTYQALTMYTQEQILNELITMTPFQLHTLEGSIPYIYWTVI